MKTQEYEQLAMRTQADQSVIRQRIYDAGLMATQLETAIRGMSGDVGELSSALQRYLEYGKPLDLVNVKEEIGDVLWRVVQACQACGFTLEEVMRANISKLAVRFGDKYTDYKAAEENRNRTAERVAVENEIVAIVNGLPKPADFHYECKVCSNEPDDEGILRHGKSCYVIDSQGGGEEYIESADKSKKCSGCKAVQPVNSMGLCDKCSTALSDFVEDQNKRHDEKASLTTVVKKVGPRIGHPFEHPIKRGGSGDIQQPGNGFAEPTTDGSDSCVDVSNSEATVNQIPAGYSPMKPMTGFQVARGIVLAYLDRKDAAQAMRQIELHEGLANASAK